MGFKLGNIQVFPNNYYFDFMKWRKLTVGVSLILVLLSLGVIIGKGLNYSIDFLGGSQIQVNVAYNQVSRDDLTKIVSENGFKHFDVSTFGTLNSKLGTQSYVIRIQREKGADENATTDKASALVSVLKKTYGEDKIQIASMTNISGKVGKEDENKGYLALAIACLGILIYIAARFDARFAPGAVLCLIHNVIIALGFMTFLDKPFTTASIAAFLTIVGYTINDTVIVYDRIRETRILQPKLELIEVVNKSISQTMNRTVLTSVTGILALFVLSTLGGGSIEDFAITMLVGIIVGTYSSIYVAAPLTLMMDKWLVGFSKPQVMQVQNLNAKNQDYAPPIRFKKKEDSV